MAYGQQSQPVAYLYYVTGGFGNKPPRYELLMALFPPQGPMPYECEGTLKTVPLGRCKLVYSLTKLDFNGMPQQQGGRGGYQQQQYQQQQHGGYQQQGGFQRPQNGFQQQQQYQPPPQQWSAQPGAPQQVQQQAYQAQQPVQFQSPPVQQQAAAPIPMTTPFDGPGDADPGLS